MSPRPMPPKGNIGTLRKRPAAARLCVMSAGLELGKVDCGGHSLIAGVVEMYPVAAVEFGLQF